MKNSEILRPTDEAAAGRHTEEPEPSQSGTAPALTLSVVVPVYQAQDCLQELHRRIVQALESAGLSFELILVDDNSADSSWEIIKTLSAQDSRVKGLRFSRNFGQHYGITAGIDHSCGQWTVVMDCDLQDRPEEIPRLHAAALQGFDIVLAKRSKRQDGRLKKMSSKLFYHLFSYLADMHYDGDVGNFRIISRKVVVGYLAMRENLRFFGAQIQWLGFPTTAIEVEHASRFAGQSTYSVSKLLSLAIETIIAYSDKPLRVAVKFGFFMAATAFLAGTYVVVHGLLQQTPVLGWSSLMASIYFLGGINIALLGVLGTYVGKTFSETKKRPLYIVREVVGAGFDA